MEEQVSICETHHPRCLCPSLCSSPPRSPRGVHSYQLSFISMYAYHRNMDTRRVRSCPHRFPGAVRLSRDDTFAHARHEILHRVALMNHGSAAAAWEQHLAARMWDEVGL